MKQSQNRRMPTPIMKKSFHEYWSKVHFGPMESLLLQKASQRIGTGNNMETDVENYLVEMVEAHGGMCEKFVTPGKVGPPDRIASYTDARIHFIETKTISGTLESWQKRDHARRRKLGFVVVVLWTKEQVDEYANKYLHNFSPRYTCRCGKTR